MTDDNPPHGLAPDVEALVIAAQAWRAEVKEPHYQTDQVQALVAAVDALDPLGQSFTRNIATAPRGKAAPLVIDVELDATKFVAELKALNDATSRHIEAARHLAAIPFQSRPSIPVADVLAIIDDVERDHDVELHDIAARIRERIEDATR